MFKLDWEKYFAKYVNESETSSKDNKKIEDKNNYARAGAVDSKDKS
jgi:hypothetical protein